MPAALPLPRALACALALALAACEPAAPDGEGTASAAAGDPAPARPGPDTARWEVVDPLREAAAASHGPSDGGGRAWLEGDPAAVERAARARFQLVYEVGPEGIAPGGAVHLQVSPFWGWSTPQVESPEAPGYTTVRAVPDDIRFRAQTLDQQLLGIQVTGRALVEGDRFEIVYGAGPAGATTDTYAERDSRFWFAVDGDGDGTRRFLPDSPGVDVLAGPPTRLRVTAPSVVRPGERFRVTLAWLDAAGNAGTRYEGWVRFSDTPAGLELPESVRFIADDGGVRAVEGVAREPGLYRLAVEAGEARVASNPLQVDASAPRILWGDLHGHSALSDGTGLPDDYYRYARDVSGLDVASLTDHDHWGLLPLVEHPALWERIRASTARFHEPGRFVALLGFEWTSWIHGHRHVLYFGDEGAVIDSVAEETDSPEELWAALDELGGPPALTMAHHPAGGPVAVNWDVPPDPRYEPVTEIVSIHGSSEAADSPGLIYDAVPGHFARDALDRGYRLGFVGGGDRHDGHPGTVDTSPWEGGLAAILSEERTREGVLAALRERRVYASNGVRIILRAALGGVPMGGVLEVAPGERRTESLFAQAVGEGPLASIELVRSGRLVDGLALEGQLEASVAREVEDLEAGEYLYVRVVQEDGGAAWSSPIWVGESRTP